VTIAGLRLPASPRPASFCVPTRAAMRPNHTQLADSKECTARCTVHGVQCTVRIDIKNGVLRIDINVRSTVYTAYQR
jgi:hypothetical protein